MLIFQGAAQPSSNLFCLSYTSRDIDIDKIPIISNDIEILFNNYLLIWKHIEPLNHNLIWCNIFIMSSDVIKTADFLVQQKPRPCMSAGVGAVTELKRSALTAGGHTHTHTQTRI